ncbi:MULTISPECIES: hypothetical protein [unclassified Arsenophonus]|uniref:hypothetical protein n=1 Tax=unclassified Arsenophonus TaxID=2627083 RepID=UPI002FF20EE7
MGQVAFDTQEFVEALEKEGLPRNQAKAISLVIRKSHEVADLATKADITEVKRDIADVRKDLSAEISMVKRDLDDVRKDLTTQISLVRKDLQLEMSGIRAEQKLIRWMLGAGILGILSLVVKAFLMPAL